MNITVKQVKTYGWRDVSKIPPAKNQQSLGLHNHDNYIGVVKHEVRMKPLHILWLTGLLANR